MASSFSDRAASRAARYRESVAALQAQGDFGGAQLEAIRWLRGEQAKVRRRRPHDADAVDAAVTAKIVALAEQIPFFKPGAG